LTSLPRLPNTLKILYCWCNQITSIPNLPNDIEYFYCWHNNLTLSTIQGWNTFNKFKTTYYKLKYGPKLERYFLNVMKKKKQQLNNELLYSPHLKFYKQFADPITLETMKN
jgi:Leucine-rich repeat (LRR) protein